MLDIEFTITLGVALVYFVGILLLGGLSLGYIFRKVYKDNVISMQLYEESLKLQKREIIQLSLELDRTRMTLSKLIYEVHHHFENPLLKRIRGLINTLEHLRVSIPQILHLIKRPTDYRYAQLALKEWHKMDESLTHLWQVAKDLEDVIIEKATAAQDLTK